MLLELISPTRQQTTVWNSGFKNYPCNPLLAGLICWYQLEFNFMKSGSIKLKLPLASFYISVDPWDSHLRRPITSQCTDTDCWFRWRPAMPGSAKCILIIAQFSKICCKSRLVKRRESTCTCSVKTHFQLKLLKRKITAPGSFGLSLRCRKVRPGPSTLGRRFSL